VDVTAADVLSELNEALRDMGVTLAFAELKDPVKDKLKRFGIFDQFGEEFFFATICAAVDAYDSVGLRLTKPVGNDAMAMAPRVLWLS